MDEDGKIRAEKKPSMKRRMTEHDYTERNIYMLTLVVEGRQALLGHVVGRGDAAADSPEAPRFVPSPLGVLVSSEVEHISEHYPQIRVLGRQLMPDHLHIILFVTEQLPQPLGRVVNGFKVGCRRAMRGLAQGGFTAPQSGTARDTAERHEAESGESGTARDTAERHEAGSGESGTARDTAERHETGSGESGTARDTAERHEAGSGASNDGRNGGASNDGRNSGASNGGRDNGASSDSRDGGGVGCRAALRQGVGVLFERGYNDRILYGKGQLQAMLDYIHDNPRRLLVKRQHPEFFHLHTFSLNGISFQAVGNMRLMDAPRRLVVRCSRRATYAEIAELTARLMAAAEEGAIPVSPFISPGERQIELALLKAGMPFIRLTDNGFPPYYKPYGRYFEACACGQLLLLSPFPYSTQRTMLSRQQCLWLNSVAEQLSAAADGRPAVT